MKKLIRWLFKRKPKDYRKEGIKYEKKLIKYFQRQGYKDVKQTPKFVRYPNSDKWYPQSDFGADLTMRDSRGRLIVVQAKWKKNGRVGPKAVSEVSGAKQHYKAKRALLVTNSTFSNDARTLAQSLKVELIENVKP